MSPSDLAARVAALRGQAESLVAALNALAGALPDWRDDAEGEEYAMAAVRAELEEAASWVEPALDYLTPRKDDNDPACCAHRKLQALIGQPTPA